MALNVSSPPKSDGNWIGNSKLETSNFEFPTQDSSVSDPSLTLLTPSAQRLHASYRLSFYGAVAIIPRFCFRMPDSEQGLFLARSLKYLQESLRRSGPAAAASYALLGAIVVLGGIGYLLDSWRGTSPWFFLTGLLLGLIVGFVGLARVVFKK